MTKNLSDMAYRFTDTQKWADEWFVDLSAHGKLMFLYLCDSCDIAGFVELSLRKMSFDLAISNEDVKIALKEIERGYLLSSDKKVIYIKNFIKHQKNLPLNPENKAHKGILNRFDNYKNKFNDNLLETVIISKNEGASKGLKSSIGNGIGNDSGFEDFKREEKIKKTPLQKAFDDFIDMRKKIKKPATEYAIKLLKSKLWKLSNSNEDVAIKILEQSILNNYQDVYELKTESPTYHKPQKSYNNGYQGGEVGN